MLSRIFARFQPLVVVDAESEELVFRGRDREVRARPFVRVTDDDRIVAFGDDALKDQPGRLVNVLQEDPDACTVFCRRLLREACAGSTLSPRVSIRESRVRAQFGPEAPALIRRCLQADRFVAELGE